MFPTDPEEVQAEELNQEELSQEVAQDEAPAEQAVADIEVSEKDTLTQIEERVLRTVELVNSLRQERDAVAGELAQLRAEYEQSEAANRSLSDEIASLKAERQKVRGRLERLLGHIDQLN